MARDRDCREGVELSVCNEVMTARSRARSRSRSRSMQSGISAVAGSSLPVLLRFIRRRKSAMHVGRGSTDLGETIEVAFFFALSLSPFFLRLI